jgi:ligand-binding sensor protein
MTLMDLKKKEAWKSILDRFSLDVNMTACLIDEAGNSLLCSFDRYPLCRTIRDDQEAATYICSQTNIAMIAVVKRTLRPEVDVCEAGLLRVVVPIVQDGVVVGQIAACGLASEDEELGSFVVAKQLGVSEEQVEGLARSTPFGSEEELQRLGERLFDELSSNRSQPGRN